MSRRPLGEQAMTGAERQRRYMAKLRRRPPPGLLIDMAAAVAPPAADRMAFQAWFAARMPAGGVSWFITDQDGDYTRDIVQAAWEAWQARG